MALLVGDNTLGSYTLTDDIYSANDEFFRSFTAVATASVDTLHLYVADMWTAGNYKITLRDASGNLLAVGATTGTGSRSVNVSGQGATVTSGNTYILGFIPDAGYLKPYNDNVNNIVRNDTASTYAAPADPVNTAAPTQAKGQFAIWAEGVTGPTFTAIDSPITNSITGVVSSSVTATGYRITAGGVTITHAVDGSPVTGTAFNIAALSRGNLPAIGTSITIELMDGATVRATTTTDLQPEVGQAAIVASANTTASNSIYNPLYCTGTPLDGDQHQWTTTDGVTIDAAGLVTGEGAFSVRHWELATGTWGAWADYTVSDGIIWVRGGMIDVMRENMIRVM